MKKVLLSILALATTASMMAVEINSHYGIEAGYDFQTTTIKTKLGKVDKESGEAAILGAHDMHGFHIGGTYEMDFMGATPANHILGLEFGLNYQFLGYDMLSTKEGKETRKAFVDGAKAEGLKNPQMISFAHQHALQVPIHFKYTYQINDSWSVFGFTGPQLRFVVAQDWTESMSYVYDGKKEGQTATIDMINGTTNITVWEDGKAQHENNKAEAKEELLSCFDMDWGFGVGAAYKNLSVNLNYNLGMMNRLPKDYRTDIPTFRQDVLSVTIGYRLQ